MLVQIKKTGKGKKIYSTHPLFSDLVTRSIIDDKIIYKKAGIFDNKTYNFDYTGARFHSSIPSNIEDGEYEINQEESNEDMVIINLN